MANPCPIRIIHLIPLEPGKSPGEKGTIVRSGTGHRNESFSNGCADTASLLSG
jgi:hypothetical protein